MGDFSDITDERIREQEDHWARINDPDYPAIVAARLLNPLEDIKAVKECASDACSMQFEGENREKVKAGLFKRGLEWKALWEDESYPINSVIQTLGSMLETSEIPWLLEFCKPEDDISIRHQAFVMLERQLESHPTEDPAIINQIRDTIFNLVSVSFLPREPMHPLCLLWDWHMVRLSILVDHPDLLKIEEKYKNVQRLLPTFLVKDLIQTCAIWRKKKFSESRIAKLSLAIDRWSKWDKEASKRYNECH